MVGVFLSRDSPPTSTRYGFSGPDLGKGSSWSVVCERPTAGAGREQNRPAPLRQRPLPSAATRSRRLRSPTVVALPGGLGRRVTAPQGPGRFQRSGGKPLPLGGCSQGRAIALTASPFPAFAQRLRKDRVGIERQFGDLTNWGAG
jgi:hypothetical protein